MIDSVFKYLKSYSTDPEEVNRLLVSCFVSLNKIVPEKNTIIKSLLIKENDHDFESFLFFEKLLNNLTLEDLIRLFEYVISPKEKIVTGAVYTPFNIREYIISSLSINDNLAISDSLFADISCGCGGFLLDAAILLKRKTQKSYYEIYSKNLYGLDIAYYSIDRTKIILSLLALINGEDRNLKFNLFVGNALDFNWVESCKQVHLNNGFDFVIGNPPYICSRNIDESTKVLLKNWEVTKSGHPDLYIPFFQIAIENLKPEGSLGYITVNTFFKSLNGRALREYFSKSRLDVKIIDFRSEQIFKNRKTYTCICLIRKSESEGVKYLHTSSKALKEVSWSSFHLNQYEQLDHYNGWNLGGGAVVKTIKKILQFESKIFSKFDFSTGIATLKNEVYKFRPLQEDDNFYHFKVNNRIKKIEKGICREVINSNKVTTECELEVLKEKIIFPYVWDNDLEKYKLLKEEEFIARFPCAYEYLKENKKILAQRDKGKQDNYEAWYAYGRNQSLNCNGLKLFLPHITNNPSYVLSDDRHLLFYNGEAIISNNRSELIILKKILESEIFWFYIKFTSRPYNAGYFSLGKNYIKGFSLPSFTNDEREFLINSENKEAILDFLLRKYGISRNELLLKA